MKRKWLSDLGLLFVTFIWGSTFIVVQNAVNLMPPFAFNAWRFLAAAVVLGAAAGFIAIKNPKAFNTQLIRHGLALGVLLFVGYGTQTLALLYTTSSKTAFITGLSVVLVPVLAWALLKNRPEKTAWFGAVIATLGLYFLSDLDGFAIQRGDALALMCAFAFGLHIVLTAKVTRDHSSLLLTAVQLVTVSLLNFLCGALFDGVRTTFSWQPFARGQVLFACLFTALFATALAYSLQTSLQRFTPPAHVAIIFLMEPVFAAATARVTAGETLSLSGKIGAVLILGGMLLSEWPAKKTPSPLPATGNKAAAGRNGNG